MPRRSATSRAIARVVAVLAMALAVVGALSLLNKADSDTEPSTVTTIATSCGEFEAAAHRLFDKGDSTALSGTFAAGDHVHLAIDFTGADYAWKATGVLANVQKTDVRAFGPIKFTKSTKTTTHVGFIPFTRSGTTALVSGTVSGSGRLELDIDATAAGVGAITVSKTGSAPSATSPHVASAGCNAHQVQRIDTHS